MAISTILAATTALSATITSAQTTTPAPATTILSIFEENNSLNSQVFSNMGGSIVGVDSSNQTTIAINCVQSLLANCSFSSYVLPMTITSGPSTFAWSMSSTTQSDSVYYIAGQSQDCKVVGSTQSASCLIYDNYWYSNISTTSEFSTSATVELSAAQITYDVLTVTAGVEKLIAASTTTTSNTATATSVSASINEGKHNSKAWIAGPVIGAVAGCAIIAGGVYWCLLRRRKASNDNEKSDSVPSCRSPEMDTNQFQTKEEWRAELPSPTPAPPPAELEARERRSVHELDQTP